MAVAPHGYIGSMSALGWWTKRPSVDYVFAGAVVAGYGIARSVGAVGGVLALHPAARAIFYPAFMAAASAVLAFILVPAAIVLAVSSGPRLEYVLSRHPGDLRRATVSGALASLLSLAVGLVAIGFGTGHQGSLAVWCLILFALLVLFGGALRMIALFSVLLRDITADRQHGVGSNTIPGPVPVPEAGGGATVHALRSSFR